MCTDASRRNWRIRLQDILECISKIQTYINGMTLEQFEKDSLRVDAVIRNFEIIGEAASQIPTEIQRKYPDLAWFEMRGMRNLMVHEYFGVSLPIIWHTIRHDLQPLADDLIKILEEQESPTS